MGRMVSEEEVHAISTVLHGAGALAARIQDYTIGETIDFGSMITDLHNNGYISSKNLGLIEELIRKKTRTA
ncbi:hypothetical protein [Priestia sp. GS2]|uniref:hypothetical protein n=1 Tax=Priestia sp. GS2 TaxID=3117403 RepID=UPI002ED7DBB6